MTSCNYQPSEWPGDESWARLNNNQYDKVGFLEGVYDEYTKNKEPVELKFAGVYSLGSPNNFFRVTPSPVPVPTPMSVPRNVPRNVPTPAAPTPVTLTYRVPVTHSVPVTTEVPVTHTIATQPVMQTVPVMTQTVPVVTVHDSSPVAHVQVPNVIEGFEPLEISGRGGNTRPNFGYDTRPTTRPTRPDFGSDIGFGTRPHPRPPSPRPPSPRPPHPRPPSPRPPHPRPPSPRPRPRPQPDRNWWSNRPRPHPWGPGPVIRRSWPNVYGFPIWFNQPMNSFPLGWDIITAREIYPNIRVVKADGIDVATTMDYQPERLNVETVNNIIIRSYGFY
ncbi:hypothetical protein [Acanthamoeba castellanii mimivirus]|uniref:Uncharacterized protein R610 n=5 Tax=Mimivirus TaxID=315393 RepID=YR610_MIMIV|nr:hypothetical protein MIMI_gp0656 [Acanthamoeba polyphaga mimivirus]Q7T6X1.2 RecName: Full=Uncharacterized protein R610 [Acanthamoeba polyphaga mimivirus]AHA45234.1 hypothetical protein HIRU_S328 [Hirudovirus strain Sangsue]ALR84198.1 hypothetical protein [Niemeyer virus]AMK61968.1 proline rich protein [Samba virus]AMZ03053.1 hypothetical protein [Mimivirus Bombay]BAV61726.1 hypothetical protein [Acanthamoeba castellanii mimivirus]